MKELFAFGSTLLMLLLYVLKWRIDPKTVQDKDKEKLWNALAEKDTDTLRTVLHRYRVRDAPTRVKRES